MIIDTLEKTIRSIHMREQDASSIMIATRTANC